MDRLLYFGYVILTSVRHWSKLAEFSRFYRAKYNRRSWFFLFDAYIHYLKYNIHPLDYFYFDVFDSPSFKPQEHASTLFMHQFHLKMNDRKLSRYFNDKILFHQKFRSLIGYDFLILKKIQMEELAQWLKIKNPESVVVKKKKSVGGFGVKRIRITINDHGVFLDGLPLSQKMIVLKGFDLMEEFVIQHDLINKLNPSCLNTVRVVTVLDKNSHIHFLGAVMRLGVKNDVDNFHSGGIAVKINMETGALEGDGFRLAPSAERDYPVHPVTKIRFDGFQLPYWNQVLDLVKVASMVIPRVRTVGWDVAIKPEGVCLIEGNHDWDKIIIEKALKKGIRKDLERFLE